MIIDILLAIPTVYYVGSGVFNVLIYSYALWSDKYEEKNMNGMGTEDAPLLTMALLFFLGFFLFPAQITSDRTIEEMTMFERVDTQPDNETVDIHVRVKDVSVEDDGNVSVAVGYHTAKGSSVHQEFTMSREQAAILTAQMVAATKESYEKA